MHSFPRNLMAIGRSVVYYARAAHAFSVGNKCWHCRKTECLVKITVVSSGLMQFLIITWEFGNFTNYLKENSLKCFNKHSPSNIFPFIFWPKTDFRPIPNNNCAEATGTSSTYLLCVLATYVRS